MSASYNVVSNADAVFSLGTTNRVRVSATSPAKFFRLERTATPGHVQVGP